MPAPSAFEFVPAAWEALRDEAMRAEQTVAVHPDVARWRAYRALDMVLATIEAYEGFPPQHRPLAERLTHSAFNAWLKTHPAPVKMWMHRIRQAGLVGAHVDSEWARSVQDAQRVVETLHKLLWWLADTYASVPEATRPALVWSDLDTPVAAPSDAPSDAEAEPEAAPETASSEGAAQDITPGNAERNAEREAAPDDPARDPARDVDDRDVRAWIAQVRNADPASDTAQRAAARVLQHIHATNTLLLTPFAADA